MRQKKPKSRPAAPAPDTRPLLVEVGYAILEPDGSVRLIVQGDGPMDPAVPF